eukprot:6482065-Amphidinium_carterae.2
MHLLELAELKRQAWHGTVSPSNILYIPCMSIVFEVVSSQTTGVGVRVAVLTDTVGLEDWQQHANRVSVSDAQASRGPVSDEGTRKIVACVSSHAARMGWTAPKLHLTTPQKDNGGSQSAQ